MGVFDLILQQSAAAFHSVVSGFFDILSLIVYFTSVWPQYFFTIIVYIYPDWALPNILYNVTPSKNAIQVVPLPGHAHGYERVYLSLSSGRYTLPYDIRGEEVETFSFTHMT